MGAHRAYAALATRSDIQNKIKWIKRSGSTIWRVASNIAYPVHIRRTSLSALSIYSITTTSTMAIQLVRRAINSRKTIRIPHRLRWGGMSDLGGGLDAHAKMQLNLF